jgi:enediyne biosynthesis protein E4
MIETMGAGAVAFDYDGDGDPDLLLLDSGPLPLAAGAVPAHALLRNDGGRFTAIDTTAAGLAVPCYAMGGVAGDVDGDGAIDLYLTCYGANRLFRNLGDGTFREQGAAAGVADPGWGTAATFFDADGDGDLDLYVANYLHFTFADNRACGRPAEGLRSYCHPDQYEAQADRLFRNRGDGTFEDATVELGFQVPAPGKGLGAVAADLDDDGVPELFVANDMTPDFLFRRGAGGRYEEVGLFAGVAMSDTGAVEAGMGVATGDLDGDGLDELVVTHLSRQTMAVWRNRGEMLFVDARYASRLAEPSIDKVGFGTAAADLDLDGDLDLAVANGHILHIAEALQPGARYRQPNQVMENLGDGVFREVGEAAGLTHVRASRGLALGDFDGDGLADLAINNSDDVAELYRNVTSPRGGLLAVDLIGGTGGQGVGARVTVTAGGRSLRQEVRTGGSYLSQSELTLRFGLAEAREATVEVAWGPHRRQQFVRVPGGRRVLLVAPASGAAPAGVEPR